MVDTFAPLDLGEGGLAVEDPAYAWTWAGRGPDAGRRPTAGRRSSATPDRHRRHVARFPAAASTGGLMAG